MQRAMNLSCTLCAPSRHAIRLPAARHRPCRQAERRAVQQTHRCLPPLECCSPEARWQNVMYIGLHLDLM